MNFCLNHHHHKAHHTMSYQSSNTTHNCTPQTHYHHLPINLAPIKRENDSDEDDDVVLLESVPKFEHSAEDYDPECNCRMCLIVKKLVPQCKCEDCQGQQSPDNQVNRSVDGQVALQSTENVRHQEVATSNTQFLYQDSLPVLDSNEYVTHDDEVAAPNNETSESSIHNDGSISEHSSGDAHDVHSRSSTPDYLPRFFDDDESESGDSSSNDDDENEIQSSKDTKSIDSVQRFKCPSCNQSFAVKRHVYRHYRSIHQRLKPYFCKWHKCAFVTGRQDGLLDHITLKHFNNRKDNEKAKMYIGKRETSSVPNDSILVKSIFEGKLEIKSECSLCRRIVHTSQLASHIRTHERPGICCIWPNCGFFFSYKRWAKMHVCADHLKVPVESANSQQVYQYLVKVDPRTDQTNQIDVQQSTGNVNSKEMVTQNAEESSDLLIDASTSEPISGDGNDGCESRSSTPDYLPRFFDDDDDESESCDSSSDDDEEVDDRKDDDQKLNKECENDDDDDGDEDYKASGQESDSDDDDSSEFYYSDDNGEEDGSDSSDSDYVLSSSRQSLKRSHDKSAINQSSKHTETIDSAKRLHKDYLEQTGNKRNPKSCPLCRRIFSDTGHLKLHIPVHKKWGFRCTWPKCGFFYRVLPEAKEHLCADHIQCSSVELTNSQVHRYLVRVNPKTGETCRIKRLQNSGHNSTGHPQPSKDPNARQMDTFDCPKCEAGFKERGQLLRHYRGTHQEWKPYYCQWPKCKFKSSIHYDVVRHADRHHFNLANREKARKYVRERAMTFPSTQKDPVYEKLLRDTSFNQNCRKCGRNFRKPGHFAVHLRTHKMSGFRCTYKRCGFFYSKYTYAKQHILEEHLKCKMVNSDQINIHLVKVEPKKGSFMQNLDNIYCLSRTQ